MNLIAMTYNICSGKNLAGERNLAYAASVINEIRPDFVTINEVRCHTADAPVHQANETGRLTGYYPVFGKSIDVSGGDYGNAFLTHWPLIEAEVVHIPDRKYQDKGSYEHRTLLRCVVEVRGRRITVIGTHFGLMQEEKESAVETALEIVGKEENPVVLMGDLNMSPDDPILQPLFKALHDTGNRTAEIKTFPSDAPRVKIDYILHTGEFTGLSLKSMDTQCSDHRPLIAELSID